MTMTPEAMARTLSTLGYGLILTAVVGSGVLRSQAVFQPLIPPQTFVGFGAAVSISGNTAIVGSPGEPGMGLSTGAAYVFVRNGTSWQFQQKLGPSGPHAYRAFGGDVAVSGDTAVVGRAREAAVDTGSAFIFVRTGGLWTQRAELRGVSNDLFGTSVDVSGDTVLVAAPYAATGGKVHVYTRQGAAWSLQTELTAQDHYAGDDFGGSDGNGIALDGDTALIGARGPNNDPGAAHVFVRFGGVWTQEVKLTNLSGSPDRGFGSSVALSGDIALLGSSSGGAHVFTRSERLWSFDVRLAHPPSTGNGPSYSCCADVAMSGDLALIAGAQLHPTTGFSSFGMVFRRIGSDWRFQEDLQPANARVYAVDLAGDVGLLGAGAGLDQTAGAYVVTIPPPPVPGPPTLTAAVTGTSVTLSWVPAPTGAPPTSFVVEAGTAPGATNLFNGNVGAVTALGATVGPGTYYVRVRAVNEAGSSAPSNEVTLTVGGRAPGQPTVTSAVASGSTLAIVWLPGGGATPTSHRLDFYWGGTLVATVGTGGGSQVSMPIPAGTQGNFAVRVTALSGAIAGPASAPFHFVIGSACTVPASPDVSGGVVGGTASVSWPAVPGATSYLVSAGTTPGGTQYLAPTNIGATTGTSASGLPAGFTAWVRVIAVNGCGQQSAPRDFFVQ